MEKLINENSKGPYIAFGTVYVMNETLRAHIHRTSNGHISEGIFGFDCKSKVC